MIYTLGDYRIDSALFQITRGPETLAVEPQVLEILVTLIDNRDHVMTRDELLDTVWKGRIVSDTTISSRIKSARRVIGDDGTHQRWIKTVHKRGFRFIGPVTVKAGEPEPAARLEPTAIPRPPTHYAMSGDTHVAYQLFGAGPVNLVVVPGYISHIDNYWDFPDLNRHLRRLGEAARVAIFDKRGTGMSDKVDALPHMDERMDDVRAVMDAAGFERAVIYGISEGGSLATLFGAYHPQRCDGLILYGAFAQFKHWFPDEASLQKLFDYVESDWGSGQSLTLYAPSLAGDAAATEWWGKYERLGATPGACVTLMRMNSRIDISGILSSVRVPTLVIHRTGDTWVSVAGGRQLAAEIPSARMLELPGKDHLPCAGDNQDNITDAILDFLKRPAEQPRSRGFLATIILVQRGGKISSPLPDKVVSTVRDRILPYRASHIRTNSSSIVATFDAPARALECARAVGDSLRAEHIKHRIAVHAGEVDIDGDGRLCGVALDVAADIIEHTNANEVLASRTVKDLVPGANLELQDTGKYPLPSIQKDWHLFRLVGDHHEAGHPTAV